MLGFLRPYRRGVALSTALAVSAMAMTVTIPWLIARSVDAIQRGDEPALLPIALVVLAAGVLRLALSVARRLIAGRVSLGVEYDLRNNIYRHLQSLEIAFFDQQQSGQLMSRATADLQGIRFFLGYGLVFLVQELLTILLAGAVMFIINPALAALALSPAPLIILIARQYGRHARPSLQLVQQRVAEVAAGAEETISGIRVVKAFAREPLQLERFQEKVAQVFNQSMHATRLRAIYSPFIALLPNIGLAIVLIVGGRLAINGSITLGEFVLFYTYLLMLVLPMRRFGMALGQAQRAVASGNRVFEILDRAPIIKSKPGAPPIGAGRGAVQFRDVTFSYGNSEAALTSINLEVPAGQTVALTGPTASGKTTLVQLIPRLYDIDSGQVLVDGVDVSDVEVSSLRREIAFVSDDSFLFSATVRDNISYAKPEATMDEIVEAATRAHSHHFIERLPDGYETVIGERGFTLSGGQRQRIAIARALLSEPRILVLDDATSNVDAATEAEIRKALQEVMRDRTTFIIAHRRSTLSLADEIVVMDLGQIVAKGTHDDLADQEGIYSEILKHERVEHDHISYGAPEVTGL